MVLVPGFMVLGFVVPGFVVPGFAAIAPWLWQISLGLAGVVLAEVARDCYHIGGHVWEPLKYPHNLHHKAYRRDLSMVSLEAYCTAQWRNDFPEALFMATIAALGALLSHQAAIGFGVLYALGFALTAWARSRGWLLSTDLAHKPGDLDENPSRWLVNRTYHWRHHFDSGNAYFCGYLTFVDQLLGTALALKGKSIAVTGATGAMGRALIDRLAAEGARPIALTTQTGNAADLGFPESIAVITWQPGQEADLKAQLQGVDILVINHGANEPQARHPEAIAAAIETNTLSAFRLLEVFLSTVNRSEHRAIKEVWVNTSEAEVNPAFSPLYELSKRAIGDIITLRRLDAPCTIRKLILGPFKSQLNPIGVMSAPLVARAIVALAKRDVRNIIVTINPLTYLLFPLKETCQSLYFRLCTRSQ